MMKIQKRQFRKKSAQAGFTVVELSVAVAIAGILLVGAISLVQTVLQTSRANDTAGGLSRVFAQIEKYYNNQPDYSGINTDGMVGLGVFQGPFLASGTSPNQSVNSRFGYQVAVTALTNYSSGSVNGKNQAYAVVFSGVPQKVCADLVTAADSIGVKAIGVFGEGGNPGTGYANYTTKFTNLAANSALTVAAQGVNLGLVKGTDNGGQLNTTAMTSVNGCNRPDSTVALAFVNWK